MTQSLHIPPKQWDTFVTNHPRGHLLQTSGWGQLKSEFGWEALTIGITNDQGEVVAGAMILLRSLPFRLGKLAYVPFGPLLTDDSQQQDIWDVIHSTAKQNGARLMKWEPGFYTEQEPPAITAMGFRESPQTVQPPRTIFIDITGEGDDILARMNQGTRRKIRKSLKNDIQYYHATVEDIPKFTAMMTTTGQRNEFGVHSAYLLSTGI